MYFPILRSKQFELIALRELAKILPRDTITPVIEPVRKNLTPLIKTIKVLNENGITPIIIINPDIGDYNSGANANLYNDLTSEIGEKDFTPCIAVNSSEDNHASQLIQTFSDSAFSLVKGGIEKSMIGTLNNSLSTIVNKKTVNQAALSHLDSFVIYGDFFEKKVRNKDYSKKSNFSTLHTEYKLYKNCIGFGDFTILSEGYTESGGPAYVVTVHLSYIDQDEFDAICVYHFSSYDDESPSDPGGKFKDALGKLSKFAQENNDIFYETEGLNDLLKTHEAGHFPGLGQVKKMSLKHHIETTCTYISEHVND